MNEVDYEKAFRALLDVCKAASTVLHNADIPAVEARGRVMSKLAVAVYRAEETVGRPVASAQEDVPRFVGLSPAPAVGFVGGLPAPEGGPCAEYDLSAIEKAVMS